MTDSKRIFLDTSPLIYYLQSNEQYYLPMKCFLEKNRDCDYITSSITITEYLTYPYRQNKLQMVDDFYSFIAGMEIEIKDRKIAQKAAWIRAEYQFFKTMDALQLATACLTECDLFLTNDKQLRQFEEMKCLAVDEL